MAVMIRREIQAWGSAGLRNLDKCKEGHGCGREEGMARGRRSSAEQHVMGLMQNSRLEPGTLKTPGTTIDARTIKQRINCILGGSVAVSRRDRYRDPPVQCSLCTSSTIPLLISSGNNPAM